MGCLQTPFGSSATGCCQLSTALAQSCARPAYTGLPHNSQKHKNLYIRRLLLRGRIGRKICVCVCVCEQQIDGNRMGAGHEHQMEKVHKHVSKAGSFSVLPKCSLQGNANARGWPCTSGPLRKENSMVRARIGTLHNNQKPWGLPSPIHTPLPCAPMHMPSRVRGSCIVRSSPPTPVACQLLWLNRTTRPPVTPRSRLDAFPCTASGKLPFCKLLCEVGTLTAS